MNGKRAKELRRIARNLGNKMNLPEEDVKTEELPNKMVVTSRGAFAEVARTQRYHSKHSIKGWYRNLKEGAKKYGDAT